MRYDVMFVGGSFPMPSAGGSVNYVYRLLKEFKGLPYFVLTADEAKEDNRKFDELFPEKIIRSRYFMSVVEKPQGSRLHIFCNQIRSILITLYYIIKYKPQLVYSLEFSSLWIALLIGKLFVSYKIGLFTYAEEIQQSVRNRRHRWLIKKGLERASIIITVCDYTMSMLDSISPVRHKTVKIIPSVDKSKSSHSIVTKNSNTLKILTVARLEERKGHIDVIKALKLLKQEFSTIDYDIVGGGPYEMDIREQIKASEATDYVHLRGRISDEALYSAYEEADIFVMPHKQLKNGDTEGCPTVFLEAGLHKLPVIGGEAGGVRDAIIDGETGYICHQDSNDLYENLKKLLKDKDLRASMGEKGYEYAIQFSSDIQSRKFLEATKNALKSS